MTDSARGFTIIEVILFLAITGALFAALMVGVGVGITQQRYQDSVRSYKALLQDQYAAVLNTRNEGVAASECNDGQKAVNSAGSAAARGTTQCVLLGRAVVVGTDSTGKTTVTVSSVTGYEPPTTGLGKVGDNDTDETVIKKYSPKIATFDAVPSSLDWDMSLMVSVSSHWQGAQATFLILRSPSTGVVKVFAMASVLSAGDPLDTYIDPANETNNIENCVAGDSGLLPKQLVIVNPKVASADGISSQTLTSGSCS